MKRTPWPRRLDSLGQPPRRGRPPRIPALPATAADPPPEDDPDPLALGQNPFLGIHPGDQHKIICPLCDVQILEMEAHLRAEHPKVSLQEFHLEFPNAPLRAGLPTKDSSESGPNWVGAVPVSSREASEHPGGRDGARIEKSLPEHERPAYREDVQALVDKGYTYLYGVASVAHYMVHARRVRDLIEKVHQDTRGGVFSTENASILTALNAKIREGIKELEADKSAGTEDGDEDPVRLLEAEMAQAEKWILQHQGEFVSKCPSPACGQMLTPPELPHWAFEPLQTQQGIQWPVWNRELWELVLEGTIPLWIMAYVLRTSPEGLMYTARRRRQEWPADIDIPVQEAELGARLRNADRQVVSLLATNKGAE